MGAVVRTCPRRNDRRVPDDVACAAPPAVSGRTTRGVLDQCLCRASRCRRRHRHVSDDPRVLRPLPTSPRVATGAIRSAARGLPRRSCCQDVRLSCRHAHGMEAVDELQRPGRFRRENCSELHVRRVRVCRHCGPSPVFANVNIGATTRNTTHHTSRSSIVKLPTTNHRALASDGVARCQCIEAKMGFG